jgi:hypothetical protein
LAESIEDDKYVQDMRGSVLNADQKKTLKKPVASYFWLNFEKYKRGKKVHTFDDLKNANDVIAVDDNEKNELKKVKALRERKHWEDPLQLLHAEVSSFKFRVWWSRGRFIFMTVFFCTITSVILVLGIANYFYQVQLNLSFSILHIYSLT